MREKEPKLPNRSRDWLILFGHAGAPNVRALVRAQILGRTRNSGGPSGVHEIVEQALVPAVALVHESLPALLAICLRSGDAQRIVDGLSAITKSLPIEDGIRRSTAGCHGVDFAG
jgi:hypothetical protein